MSRQQVAKWYRSFQVGREHVENRNMEASGRPSSSRKDINTARVEEIIQRDRRVTVREIASELDLSYGNVQRIVTDELRYSKKEGKHPFLVWVMKLGLIASIYVCPKCSDDMRLCESLSVIDGFEWRCF
ncbi:histone-lysine N-methyltransferase SETMAR [Nephila pilipes]|uniref:Histone-lysine N-methyltransferase SETMAR n=1 Tax=Nephila pilipes TaxID=299642 RepID=A0A8X6TTI8_NEPPI|nr:histone-lysine N-methyltransferase SETMAR [Nephila pilipes]GFT45419.1 histone-lysine N-methyltransferase SETMAR [Nephila pilipes]